MGENHFAPLPSAAYGFVLLMAAISYWLLQHYLISAEGQDSILQRAVGIDWKGKLSPLLYIIGIGASFSAHWLAQAIYVFVALMWLVPDRRIERTIEQMET
jgi:uncharacterized membrane protein